MNARLRKTFALAPVLALLALEVTLSPGLGAQDKSEFSQPTLTVVGHGEVQAQPDVALLTLAVETSAKTASGAAGHNAEISRHVVDALKNVLRDKGRVWTGGYNLRPEYKTDEHGRPLASTIVGYVAENSVELEVTDLKLLGPLIDKAIASGANRVNSLRFSLHDESKARNAAISLAAKDAAAQARALASALGVRLQRVVKAAVGSEEISPRFYSARFNAGAAVTPIQVQQITVPATVTLIYRIE